MKLQNKFHQVRSEIRYALINKGNSDGHCHTHNIDISFSMRLFFVIVSCSYCTEYQLSPCIRGLLLILQVTCFS